MGMGKRPATYADLEALPPNRVGEIIAGELYSSPRPADGSSSMSPSCTSVVTCSFPTSLAGVATHLGEAHVRVEPFEALELELNALWGE